MGGTPMNIISDMVHMVRKSGPYGPQIWAVWSTNLGRMVHKSGPYSLVRMVHGPYGP